MSNVLTELIPRKARLWAYLVALVVSLAFTTWQAAEGNLVQLIAGLATALVNALAASNVNPPAVTNGD